MNFSNQRLTDMSELTRRIEITIQRRFSLFDFQKPRNTYRNILDTEEDRYQRSQLLKQKQIDMIQGYIWQDVFSCANGMINLGIGHVSGLDLYCPSKKQFFEIKNSVRSDNSSSRRTKEHLLCEMKRKYPDHTCIYGIVNDENKHKIKQIDGMEIHYVCGDNLFKLIFGEPWREILAFIKTTYKKYRETV